MYIRTLVNADCCSTSSFRVLFPAALLLPPCPKWHPTWSVLYTSLSPSSCHAHPAGRVHSFKRTPHGQDAASSILWEIFPSIWKVTILIPINVHVYMHVFWLYASTGNTGIDMHCICAGEDGCTMKVHLLKHIPDVVENWGPLWCYSCFSFESMNGHLKKNFHGTRSMNAQVCFLLRVYMCLYYLH